MINRQVSGNRCYNQDGVPSTWVKTASPPHVRGWHIMSRVGEVLLQPDEYFTATWVTCYKSDHCVAQIFCLRLKQEVKTHLKFRRFQWKQTQKNNSYFIQFIKPSVHEVKLRPTFLKFCRPSSSAPQHLFRIWSMVLNLMQEPPPPPPPPSLQTLGILPVSTLHRQAGPLMWFSII